MSSVLLRIINMSIAGSVIILPVLLARLLLSRAPKWTRLVLWGLVGLRLALPFFPKASFSLMPRTLEIAPITAVSGIIAPTETHAPAAEQTSIKPGISVTDGSNAPTLPREDIAERMTESEGKKPDIMTALAYVWAAGVGAMLAYALISSAVLRRRLGSAVRLEGNVYESEAVKTPFLFGLFPPRIYLPQNMEPCFREPVLAHELAHIKGLDHVFMPLGWVLLAVHWFNPITWLAFSLFSIDIELACDERVIRKLDRNERAGYSQALLNLSSGRGRISASPLAFGESNIKERIRNVTGYKKPTVFMIVSAMLTIILISGGFLTNPKATDRTDEKEPEPAGIEAVGSAEATAAEQAHVHDPAVREITLESWMTEQTENIAFEAAAKHCVVIELDNCAVTVNESLDHAVVTFTDEAETWKFEARLGYSEEEERFTLDMDDCRLIVNKPGIINEQRLMRNKAEIFLTEETVDIRDIHDGTPDRDTAARYAGKAAKALTDCLKNNYLRCIGSYIAELTEGPEGSAPVWYARIVFKPEREWFSGACEDIVSNLYDGSDVLHGGCRGWYTLLVRMSFTEEDDGSWRVSYRYLSPGEELEAGSAKHAP